MKKNASRLRGAMLVMLLLAAPAWAREKLRIGTEGAYPPFNRVTAEGELAGFDIDIARALCREMDRECTFVTKEWSNIIEGLRSNEYDAIIASMSITGKRDRLVDFTRRYYSNKLYLVAPAAIDIGADLSSLAGHSISVQRGTIAADWLEHNMGAVVEIKRYETQEGAFLGLAAGHVEASIADMLVAYEWLNSTAGQRFEFKGDALYIGDRIGIAVREGDDALRQAFNRAIATIRRSGAYDRINRKYFPFDIY